MNRLKLLEVDLVVMPNLIGKLMMFYNRIETFIRGRFQLDDRQTDIVKPESEVPKSKVKSRSPKVKSQDQKDLG